MDTEKIVAQTLAKISEKGEVTSADIFVLRYCQKTDAQKNKVPAYKQILNSVGDVVGIVRTFLGGGD